jgi:2'-5' RNA ligase
MEKTTLLNICILPEGDTAEQCVELSKRLASPDTLFTLDGVTKFPHMTVYMARFPSDSVANVEGALSEVLKNMLPIECHHSGYFLTGGNYVEVSYEKTSDFMSLHENILDAVKDLRATPGEPVEESYFAPYTSQQKKNTEETGYDLAHELFRPHVTLTRYRAGGAPAEVPESVTASGMDLTFSAKKIGLYLADENGAVYELVRSFELS